MSRKASRFDYVRYDGSSEAQQSHAKMRATALEELIEELDSSRAKDYAIKALEECYMWIGKGIRDDQIKRNGSAPLQEERNNE